MVGKFGNTLDAKAGRNILEDSDDDESDDDDGEAPDKQKTKLLKKKQEEEAVCINNSVTEPQCMRPLDHNYGYLPINEKKYCLYTIGLFEDFRKRLYHTNVLMKMSEALVTIFIHIHFQIWVLWRLLLYIGRNVEVRKCWELGVVVCFIKSQWVYLYILTQLIDLTNTVQF